MDNFASVFVWCSRFFSSRFQLKNAPVCFFSFLLFQRVCPEETDDSDSDILQYPRMTGCQKVLERKARMMSEGRTREMDRFDAWQSFIWKVNYVIQLTTLLSILIQQYHTVRESWNESWWKIKENTTTKLWINSRDIWQLFISTNYTTRKFDLIYGLIKKNEVRKI